MTKDRLYAIKSVTTWTGVLITLSGIVLNLANGGNWIGNSISLVGLLVTCIGHWISISLDRHAAAAKAANEQRLEDLESVSDFLSHSGVFDRENSLKAIIRDYEMRYDIEHQDDGR